VSPNSQRHSIQSRIAGRSHSLGSRGYSVIREFGGHGIGATFHADPLVCHHIDRHDDFIVVPGMTFTVEPMLTSGRPIFHQAADGWTEHANDNRPSAQFEHTVLVTEPVPRSSPSPTTATPPSVEWTCGQSMEPAGATH
jgi:methionine aminopeptidase